MQNKPTPLTLYHVLVQETSMHYFPTLVQRRFMNNFFKSLPLMTNIYYISLSSKLDSCE